MRTERSLAAPAVVLLLSGAFLQAFPAFAGVCGPVCAEAGAFRAFEGLRGDPLFSSGYLFTVSRDENWIAVFAADTMMVTHAPSGKTWRVPLPSDSDGGWQPNCFTGSSKELRLGPYSVELKPEAEAMSFRKTGTPSPTAMDRTAGTFLGFRGVLRNRKGAMVQSWLALDDDEGDSGRIAWSPDGRVLYEAVEGKGSTADGLLRITPPGKVSQVDFGAVREEEHEQGRVARRPVLQEAEKELGKKAAAEFEKKLKEIEASIPYMTGAGPFKLEQLAVSPDGRHLAAIASQEPGAGFQYGILISLHGPRLAARLFAAGVHGKILWAENSRRLYFYAQPLDDVEGTVYRLDLSGL